MSILREQLSEQTLRQVQDAFSALAGAAVVVTDASGQVIAAPSQDRADWRAALQQPLSPAADPAVGADAKDPAHAATVVVNGQPAGCVRLADRPDTLADPQLAENLLRLAAAVVARLCEGAVELRSRIQQLLALFRIVAEVATSSELQQILDTVTRTVAEAMGAKASTIRLLSENQRELVIASGANLSPAYLEKGPVLLADSPVDRQSLEEMAVMEIADMASDPRVLYPDDACREGLVSGLCAPMVYKQRRIGVLRVYTGTPHRFDWFQRQLLLTIASAAAVAIANARLNRQARETWQLRRQLAMAAEVQQRMIPDGPPELPGFDIHASYVPSQELSGDFYDYIELPPSNLGFAISDVVGKGVRASLLMASIRASLRAHAINVYDISEVLDLVNRDLCADSLSSDFASLFYGVLDSQTRRLTFACAGHPPPILVRNGRTTTLETHGGLLGVVPEMHYPIDTVDLQSGDVILAYTDGLSEALNFAHEEYGQGRIRDALVTAVDEHDNAAAIGRHMLWDLRRFSGLHRRFDDLTMIVVRAV